jgi:predicted nucleotidyltransferase
MGEVMADEVVLAEIVRRLVKALDPDKIILFGSRARGDSHLRSDVDLLVIKPTQESRLKRAGLAYGALSDIPVPSDVLWYTPEEVEYWSEVKYHIATRATREGRVLNERL